MFVFHISEKISLILFPHAILYGNVRCSIFKTNCDVQWKVHFIQQLGMTLSMTGLERSSKALPKAKFAPKKSWSLFGGLLPVWSTKAFWIPVKPLHLRSVLSKSVSHTENYNACSQHRSTQGTQCFCTTMLSHTSHNQRFKSWVNWATHFCHIHLTSCQQTTTSSNISTTFCKENASTTSRRQKMLS